MLAQDGHQYIPGTVWPSSALTPALSARGRDRRGFVSPQRHYELPAVDACAQGKTKYPLLRYACALVTLITLA